MEVRRGCGLPKAGVTGGYELPNVKLVPELRPSETVISALIR